MLYLINLQVAKPIITLWEEHGEKMLESSNTGKEFVPPEDG